ncbi:hypothetical protein AX17_003263 [Amanita inopinata Kibby_2008]|nr:hypothetical protein AX17_003263 [Amanita inopinata Kibby_2008]
MPPSLSTVGTRHSKRLVRRTLSAARKQVSRISRLFLRSTRHTEDSEDETRISDDKDASSRRSLDVAANGKLVPDVLRCIFLCSRESAVATIPLPKDDILLSITHVCSAWRRVALDTPELWNNVLLKVEPRKINRLRVAREWLSRADSLPRSLEIWDTDEKAAYDAYTMNAFATQRLITSFQFRRLVIRLGIAWPLTLRDIPNESLAHLEELILVSHFEVSLGSIMFSPSARFPSLTRLEISGCFDILNLGFLVPWHQLRHISLRTLTAPSDCLEALREGISLETCQIHVAAHNRYSYEHNDMPQNIPLLNLRFLALKFDDYADVQRFMRQLRVTLPNLSTLDICTGRHSRLLLDSSAMVQPLQHFEARKLQTLRMELIEANLDVGGLLQCVPSISSLKLLGGSFLDDDGLDGLGTGKLGPRLQDIYLRGDFNVDKLRCILKQRQKVAKGARSRHQDGDEVTPSLLKHAYFVTRGQAVYIKGHRVKFKSL